MFLFIYLDLNVLFFLVLTSFVFLILYFYFGNLHVCVLYVVSTDDLVAEKDKSRMLQADMEATLQDIQNM